DPDEGADGELQDRVHQGARQGQVKDLTQQGANLRRRFGESWTAVLLSRIRRKTYLSVSSVSTCVHYLCPISSDRLTRSPFRKTAWIDESARTSWSGLPSTSRRVASFPFSTVPRRDSARSNRAAFEVAAWRATSTG